MPELHPEGTFDDTKIIDHGFDESSEQKTPFFWARFETEHGILTGRFYLTEKTVEYTVKKIAAMGFDGDSLSELADGTALADGLCQITVEHEEYENKNRARVGFVNPNHSVMGPSRNEEVAANLKQFDALWKSEKKKKAEAGDVPF